MILFSKPGADLTVSTFSCDGDVVIMDAEYRLNCILMSRYTRRGVGATRQSVLTPSRIAAFLLLSTAATLKTIPKSALPQSFFRNTRRGAGATQPVWTAPSCIAAFLLHGGDRG